MINELHELNIDYSAYGISHDGTKITLELFVPDTYPEMGDGHPRPLILICPGGGYQHLSPREAEPIALRFNSFGYGAAILKYSLAPNVFPSQLIEAAESMAFLRKNSERLHIDPDKIVIAGFSAGAHVAASLGTLFNSEFAASLNIDPKLSRPDAMLLSYPVITSGEYAHRGSFENLLGKNYDKYLDFVSLEKQVTDHTPPAFIWHTFEDQAVPLENSLLFANALREHHIKFEYHVFPDGGHGLALASKETVTSDGKCYQPECMCWPDLFNEFMKKL